MTCIKVLHVHSAAPLDTDRITDCSGFSYVPRDVDLADGLLCQQARLFSSNSSLLEHHKSYSQGMSAAINQGMPSQAVYQFRWVLGSGSVTY